DRARREAVQPAQLRAGTPDHRSRLCRRPRSPRDRRATRERRATVVGRGVAPRRTRVTAARVAAAVARLGTRGDAARRGAPRLDAALAALGRGGARIAVTLPDGTVLRTSAGPPRARVVFRDEAAVRALERGRHLELAEAFLAARVDIEGDP